MIFCKTEFIKKTGFCINVRIFMLLEQFYFFLYIFKYKILIFVKRRIEILYRILVK